MDYFHVDTLRRLKNKEELELKKIKKEFNKNFKSKINKTLTKVIK